METARFALTPYFEIIDVIVPLARLRIDKCTPEDDKGRVEGKQLTEFCVRYDHSLLLSESRRQKNNSFNVRSLIRFCKFDEMRCDKYGIKLKDVFPLHLQINLNNTLVNLPNLLPNDRSGKDGRRFPRPVDLTEVIIDNPIITNRIIINWMQDEAKNEEYYFAIYLARLRPCDELCSILLNQQMSTVSSTLNFVYDQCNNLNGAVDEDLMLVNTFINTSLNCPVSRDRMKIPIRGQNCNHLQCFDCMTYLIINFKKPTWQCPVCDKKTFYCYLEVDGLIFNILKDERSKYVENIQFNNSGQWRPQRKMLGGVEDDQPYFDVINDIKQSQSPESAVSTSSIILSESFSEYKIQEHLRQILSNQGTFMNKLSNLYQPNMCNPALTSNVTTTHSHSLKFEGALNMVADCPLPVSNNDSTSMHKINGCSQSFSKVEIPKVAFNSTLNDQYLPTFDPLQYNRNFIQMPSAPPNYPSNPLLSHLNDTQKIPSSVIINDITSRLQITNVISMAQNRKSVPDTIVISDDDQEDANSVKNVIVNTEKRSHKRPTTVSSAPNDVCSKQMKIVNNTNQIFHRPNSVSSNNLTMRLKELPYLCKCTVDLVCPFHAKNMAYINKIIANSYPLDPNLCQTSVPLQHTMCDITQTKSNSNFTAPNDIHSNISSQCSLVNTHIPAKQNNPYANISSQPFIPNTSNIFRQSLALNNTNNYIPTYSIAHPPYMINNKMQHAPNSLYNNFQLKDAHIEVTGHPAISNNVSAQNISVHQAAQYALGHKSNTNVNSSVQNCNSLNIMGQPPYSLPSSQIPPLIIPEPKLDIGAQSVSHNETPIIQSYPNNIQNQPQRDICRERVGTHNFSRDVKLAVSANNPVATNILKQYPIPLNSFVSQSPMYHHSYLHPPKYIIPHGLNPEKTKPFIFPYVDIPEKSHISYDTQHRLNFNQNHQNTFHNTNVNLQSNNSPNLPNNMSNQIMQQSELSCQPQSYIPSISLYQHLPTYPNPLPQVPQMMIPISNTVCSDIPSTCLFQNINPIRLPRYPNTSPQLPQMMIPNSKMIPSDLPPSNYFSQPLNSYNCNPNYLNMFYNS